MNNKKLVIFDIDGTMITPLRPVDALQRFRFAINKVFGIDIGEVTHETWIQGNYNGMGDRAILWDLLKDKNINRDLFLDNIGALGDGFTQYLDTLDGQLYGMIPDAKKLVDLVIEADHLSEGVLTGNLGQSASWKLHHAGYSDFAFGVYGHEADVRNELAELLIPKAEKYFTQHWHPADIIIIGDTEKDIQCAKHIGAISVIVATGWDIDKKMLEHEHPDLLVDSLMDDRVLELLGLKT